MNTRIRGLAVLAPLLLSIAIASAADGLQYGEVKHKIVQKTDSEGDILVSVKVVVTNGAEQDHEVAFSVQALDAEGFEVKDVMFVGVVKASASRTFTDTFYIQEDAYKAIVRWQTEEEPLARGLTTR